ncbi:MAG: hypothetical protein Q8941_01430 [Bacteroidota bacterium]|nr:hypothetical protein [Bacteroidota bacterium]
MLLLFAVNIIPRQLLHDVITRHKHDYTKSNEPASLSATKNNFQCNWQEQSLESPFTNQPGFRLPLPPVAFSSYNDPSSNSYHSTTLFLVGLRGPPSVA